MDSALDTVCAWPRLTLCDRVTTSLRPTARLVVCAPPCVLAQERVWATEAVRAPPTLSEDERDRAAEVVCAPPTVSAEPSVWAEPQLSPCVRELNPPREVVSDAELTVLVESALNEPFVTAWELDPPTELDWLAKEPEDCVVEWLLAQPSALWAAPFPMLALTMISSRKYRKK